MRISGLTRTTLLDYPGRVACTIFLGGCNYRCPFCHNSTLVLTPGEGEEYREEDILAFLKKRQGILDGVCITGGEPTLTPELPELLEKIKEIGYAVKLDTNGSRPEILKDLVRRGLIDKAAMDIKSCPENYRKLTGIDHPDTDAVVESAKFLMECGIEYEFRTTVVKELHSAEDFEKIAEWLAGAEEYYLQEYRDSESVIRPGFSPCTLEEMNAFQRILSRTIKRVGVRGIE